MAGKKCNTSTPQYGVRNTADRIKGGNAAAMDGSVKKKKKY